MRRLADCAQLSTRTLYNLCGAKEDILLALLQETVAELTRELEQLDPEDPIARSRALISVSVDVLSAREPLYRILMSETELRSRRAGAVALWTRARALHEAAFEEAERLGLLERGVASHVLAHQILMAFAHAVRLWSRGVLDADALRAEALYAWAASLLIGASARLRPRLEAELARQRPGVESAMQQLEASGSVSELGGSESAAGGASEDSPEDPAPARRPSRALARG